MNKMHARRLTAAGVERFEQFLQTLRTDPEIDPPLEILGDPMFSEPLDAEIDAEPRAFHSRLEIAEHLHKILKGDPAGLRNDPGFWSWLALCWFDELCPETKEQRQPGENARWIANLDDPRRSCRHLLAGPWQIFQAHRDDPQRAICLLYGTPSQAGPLVRLLAARPSLASCPSVVGAASRLYFNRELGRNRPGLGGQGPGSPRRFLDILCQLELNWDLHSLTVEELLGLLPAEFDHFARTPQQNRSQRSLLDGLDP